MTYTIKSLKGAESLKKLKKLSIAGLFNIPKKQIQRVVEKIQLEKANFSYCRVDDEIVSILIINSKNKLKDINVRGCEDVTDRSLSLLNSFCPFIENINFSCNSSFSVDTLRSFSVSLCSLRKLDLCYCPKFSAPQVSSQVSQILIEISKRNPNLEMIG